MSTNTPNYGWPLQQPTSSRLLLNQTFTDIDNDLYALAKTVAEVEAMVPVTTPFGPFTATQDQTDFTLPFTPAVGASLEVIRGGISYSSMANDVVMAGSNIMRFATPSIAGEVVTGICLQNGIHAGTPPVATLPDGSIEEIPQGIQNSTDGYDGNAVFTLTYAIAVNTTPIVTVNDLELTATQNYTWSGNTITFTAGNNPFPGEQLLVRYVPAS